ncbi:MAG: four helix bundle protein [Phycisphaerae bacterium]
MAERTEHFFSHEKLEVYQQSIQFIVWLSPLMESSNKWGDVKDQLDRASTSIPLNIAEGNGKFFPKDRSRFFDIAHGSALECSAALRLLRNQSSLLNRSGPGKFRCKTLSEC